jgi:uncharacterized low-complexity protein
MMFRAILISAILMSVSTVAIAQSGSPEEQTACRADVRRFCHKLKESEGSSAFVQCLQAHRDRLSARCRAVLESHGQ